MRKRIAILLLIIVSLLTACVAPQTSGPNPEVPTDGISASAPAPSVDVLLAAALKLFVDGNYEEAILQYKAVINIEPKNFDAHFGLGKSYRANRQPEKAVASLEAAQNLRSDDKAVMLELGSAYLEVGQYTKASNLARTLWENDNSNYDAGMILIMSLAAEEDIDAVQELMEDKALVEYLSKITDEDSVYFGEYDENGERNGYGVGLYVEGYMYVYAGEYKDNVRCGQGTWLYQDGTYFNGEWADDAPNGVGTLFFNGLEVTGIYYYGLEDGEMIAKCETAIFPYHTERGKRNVIEEFTDVYGNTYHIWAWQINDSTSQKDFKGRFAAMDSGMANMEQGVMPWGQFSYSMRASLG